MPRKTALTLFAGLGATTYGQETLLGHKIVGAVELNPVAAETLRKNFDPSIVVEASVKDLDFTPYRGASVVLGGPPCQPFSQAADGNGEYDARDCIPDFIRCVSEVQPEVFIMEEVQTLTWQKHREYLDRVLADLRAAGYVVDYRVLNAAHYGVPQARKRLFVVGVRADLGREVTWPERIPYEDEVSMAKALDWTLYEAYERAEKAPVFGNPEWVFDRPSTTVVGSFRPDVQAAPGYRKAGDGPRQNTPGSVVITEEEALILQGMPTDWAIAGNEAKRRLQIGNSCPPQITSLLTRINL